MAKPDYQSILHDKLLHERTRLLILSYLLAKENQHAAFMDVQKNLELTRGNLSIQAKKLQEAGYIDISKVFKNNKPLTTLYITHEGIIALKKYLKELKQLLGK